ncbi:MAG: hypothetical protein K6D59_09895 [Bacteroidales bacterium]|nr:hypothetical protein [Bacteroidales bacterium]
MKRTLWVCFFSVFVWNGMMSQQPFLFSKINESEILYDYSKYKINVEEFKMPDTHYMSQVLSSKDYAVYSKCECINNYVFPLKVSYKDSVYLMTFTIGGLLELYDRNSIHLPQNKWPLSNTTPFQDTLSIDYLPDCIAGSANYEILHENDPEFTLFKSNKWLFMNYFFRLSETGLQYEYIGLDIQIPAVVLLLCSWGILISDGCGGDQHSAIYIESYNYPFNIESEKPSDCTWVNEWMSCFINKHIVENRIIERTEWEMWNYEWWNTKKER